jgi:hypothetical protein
MNWRACLCSTALVLAVAVLALPALAQTTATTGAIAGYVTDDKGAPLPGATVTASGVQAPASATTDANGRFAMSNLVPGTYKVRVEAQGFGTIVQTVTVSLNTRSRADFRLSPGRVEEVKVTAEAPLVDEKNVTTGATFTVDKYVDYVPVGRNFTQTFTLAPGVESGGGTGAGNYSVSGASGLENSYLIDGVNITNTGYGGVGSYNIVFGSLGSGVTYDFLDEIQVKTGGIDAEYGQATGGVINTVVKSGTNSLSGAVSIFSSPASLEKDYKLVNRLVGATNTVSSSNTDIALSLGGPLIKDRAFFFAAYNPVDSTDKFMVNDLALMENFTLGPTQYPVVAAGDQERKRHSDNWAAKFDFYVTPNHRIQLSGFGDPSNGDRGPQRADVATTLKYMDYLDGGGQSEIKYGANNYSFKYDGVFTPNFFMQVQAAKHDGKFEETPSRQLPQLTDVQQLRCYLGIAGCGTATAPPTTAATQVYGGPGFIQVDKDKNTQYKLSATWIHGPIEVKAGASLDDISYQEQTLYSGLPIQYYVPLDANLDSSYGNLDDSALQPCGSQAAGMDCYIDLTSTSGASIQKRSDTYFRVIRNRFNPLNPPTTTKDTGVFAQATWSMTPRWTLKAGVRMNHQKISGSGDFTMPFNLFYPDKNNPNSYTLVPASATTPADPEAQSIQIGHYVSQSYTFSDVYAPRLGLTWDVTGDGRTKLYLAASRYFERVPNDLAVRALSNEIGNTSYRFGAYDLATGTPSNSYYIAHPSAAMSWQGLQPEIILPDTKLPYSDELVLGAQKEVGRDLSVEVRAIYRTYGRALEDIQYTSDEAIENHYYGKDYGYPDDPFPGYGTGLFSAYVLANPGANTGDAPFPKPKRDYKALEIIANKRFSDHWMMFGNIRISELRGFYEGLFRNDNGQSDPNITSLYDFPNTPIMRGQFLNGPLNTDRPYVAKLYSSYTWDSGITLGGSFNWASGNPRTPLLAHPNYQNGGEIPGLDPLYGWWTLNQSAPNAVCYVGDGRCLAMGTAAQYNADGDAQSGYFLRDYTTVNRGGLGRNPDIALFDLMLSYNHKFGKSSFQVAATVFNLFNNREITAMDDFVEYQAGIGEPDYNTPLSYQGPRAVRVNARWSF